MLKTLEVASLADAREIGPIIDYEITDFGFLCQIEVKEKPLPANSKVKEKKEKNYIVYSPTCQKYVAKNKKYSFYECDAELFTKEDAERKAYFMSQPNPTNPCRQKWIAYKI